MNKQSNAWILVKMNSSCILRLMLLLTLIAHSKASIETETKYTIITQPGDVISNTPISKTNEVEENVNITDDIKDVTSPRIEPNDNMEDTISINVLQNGKKMFRMY